MPLSWPHVKVSRCQHVTVALLASSVVMGGRLLLPVEQGHVGVDFVTILCSYGCVSFSIQGGRAPSLFPCCQGGDVDEGCFGIHKQKILSVFL